MMWLFAAVHESESGPEPTSCDVRFLVAIRGKANARRTWLDVRIGDCHAPSPIERSESFRIARLSDAERVGGRNQSRVSDGAHIAITW
jgi:hypothetical protein